MFLPVIPPLDDEGSQSVVNIYIPAHVHLQVGCLRIRSLNTSQSDEMIESNISQNGGTHLFLFFKYFCPSSELMVVLLLCMLSVCTSRCFSCDIQ